MENGRQYRYKAVIFDLDGTLLDTLSDLTDSLNEILRQFGEQERSEEEVRSFVGNGIRKLIERALPGGKSHPRFEAVYEGFQDYYGRHCMDKTAPYPGILSLLDWLSSGGCRAAIVSNKADFAVKTLNRRYFDGLISVAIGEREGIRRKPAPDTVLQALRELGVQPEQAVYVGDSEVDLDTAKNAGMDIIAVSWGFRTREHLLACGAKPERTVSEVRELRRLLV